MSDQTVESAWVCVVESGEKFGLLAIQDDGSWVVQGFESETDGLRYFEEAYERAHARGYESSMSACINWLVFQPSILRMSLEQIRDLAAGPRIHNWSSVAGSMRVIPLKPEAEPLWESGAKPKLIR